MLFVVARGLEGHGVIGAALARPRVASQLVSVPALGLTIETCLARLALAYEISTLDVEITRVDCTGCVPLM